VRGEEVCCAQTQARNRNDNKNDRAPDPVDGCVCVGLNGCVAAWCMAARIKFRSRTLSAALECTKAERVQAQRARNKGERTP
jgi:hypothetical protein